MPSPLFGANMSDRRLISAAALVLYFDNNLIVEFVIHTNASVGWPYGEQVASQNGVHASIDGYPDSCVADYLSPRIICLDVGKEDCLRVAHEDVIYADNFISFHFLPISEPDSGR